MKDVKDAEVVDTTFQTHTGANARTHARDAVPLRPYRMKIIVDTYTKICTAKFFSDFIGDAVEEYAIKNNNKHFKAYQVKVRVRK